MKINLLLLLKPIAGLHYHEYPNFRINWDTMAINDPYHPHKIVTALTHKFDRLGDAVAFVKQNRYQLVIVKFYRVFFGWSPGVYLECAGGRN